MNQVACPSSFSTCWAILHGLCPSVDCSFVQHGTVISNVFTSFFDISIKFDLRSESVSLLHGFVGVFFFFTKSVSDKEILRVSNQNGVSLQ